MVTVPHHWVGHILAQAKVCLDLFKKTSLTQPSKSSWILLMSLVLLKVFGKDTRKKSVKLLLI